MTDIDRWRNDWDSLARRDLYGSILSMNQAYTENQFRISGMRTFLEFADHIPNNCERILDIGCGAGRVLMHAQVFAKEVIGIDISPVMLAAARERMASGALFYDSFDPVHDESVDFIYSVGVFKHLTKEMISTYLADSARVLRPEGRMYFHYYSRRPDATSSYVDEAVEDREKQEPRTNRVVPEADVMKMLGDNGLRVIDSAHYRVLATKS
jgi:cyclopropane fatty-acyl-phospholipid synthase-like methyltransferase